MKTIARVLFGAALLTSAGAWAGPPSATPPPGLTPAQLAGPGLVAVGNIQLATNLPISQHTGNAYTIQTTDGQTELQFCNAGAIAVTLPSASSVGFTSGFSFGSQNECAGTVTFTPVSGTINGNASLATPQNSGCEINSDGANWRVGPSCTAVLPGASGGGITQLTGDVTAGPGTGSTVATVAKIGGVTPGTAVGANTGTSGAALGFLNGANTFSALETFTANVSVNAGTASAPSLYGTSSATGLFFSNSTVKVTSGGAEKGCFNGAGMAIDTACGTDIVAGGQSPPLQVRNNVNSLGGNSILVDGYAASASVAAGMYCSKSRSATLGTQAAVQSGDTLCGHYDEGSDGTGFQNAVLWQSLVDGSVATGAVPGRAVLQTANSSGTLTEAFRVDSNQHHSFYTGIVPTVSGCTIDALASDRSGTVTLSSTSCVITFIHAYTNKPHTRVSFEGGASHSYTPATTTLTISGLSGDADDYETDGR